MFKFNNTHIFTGYLKQMLSSFNLPTCRVYTREFENYLKQHNKEDPRVIESFNTIEYFDSENTAISKKRAAMRVNYLRGNELYNYFWAYAQEKPRLNHDNSSWKRASTVFFQADRNMPGLTKTLNSPGIIYDTHTHEYLGDYLRFIRDYYNVNLMSLYNCFNNKICNNVYYKHKVKLANPNFKKDEDITTSNPKYLYSDRLFDARDTRYRIYALPVKLFSDYTIAIDCDTEIELFCGLYNTMLDTSEISADLIARTYKRVNRTFFNQPFLYDKLNVKYWNFDTDCAPATGETFPRLVNNSAATRWDLAAREQDLKLFIKIPVSCKSSIVVLEGDFRRFNDFKYVPPGTYNPDGTIFNSETDNESFTSSSTAWEFKQNHAAINFGDIEDRRSGLDINNSCFTPVSKLQLLAFNTGESYPFADRLIEYLGNSAITPIDKIPDNIKRVQKVMTQNQHYFKIEGLWENKMQKIIYDYMINSGPIKAEDNKLFDSHSGNNPKNYGYHSTIGHTSKSTLYDTLGYVDKDAERLYASWKIEDGKVKVRDTIQNVDIYNGLYDI